MEEINHIIVASDRTHQLRWVAIASLLVADLGPGMWLYMHPSVLWIPLYYPIVSSKFVILT